MSKVERIINGVVKVKEKEQGIAEKVSALMDESHSGFSTAVFNSLFRTL